MRRVLTDRVQVFGLPDLIDWPAGTVVEVVGERRFVTQSDVRTEFSTVEVRGPGGVVVTLPARLVRVKHQAGVA